jgi:hypothetical protein
VPEGDDKRKPRCYVKNCAVHLTKIDLFSGLIQLNARAQVFMIN